MLRLFACLFALGLTLTAAAAEPALDFIHLTDTHVIHDEGVAMPIAVARMHFSEGGRRLAEYFTGARSNPPAFFLITGDLIDAYRMEAPSGRFIEGQVEAFRAAAAGSPAPLYLALGNHDVSEYRVKERAIEVRMAAEAARAAWSAQFDCFRRGTWYSFTKRVGRTAYLFLVLETVNATAISHEQARWIRRQIASHRRSPVILAMHFPLGNNAASQSIREAAGGGGVVLALSGHVHKDGVDKAEFGPQPIVQVRTAAFGYGDGNWRKIGLREDRIEIFATGTADRVEATVPVPAAQVAANSNPRRASASAVSISAR